MVSMRLFGLCAAFVVLSGCILDRNVGTGGSGGGGGTGNEGGGGSGNQGGGGSGGECGDGILQAGEACDGAIPNGVTCETEGFVGGSLSCTPLCGLDTQGCFSCGDNVKNGTDVCDGTDLAGEDCTTQVTGSPGGALACKPNCTGYDTSMCQPPATCNNGMQDPNEDCEGANLYGEDCVSQNFDGGTLACNANCTFDTSGCFTCGDTVKNTGEDCDGADLGGATCQSLGFAAGMLSCAGDCTYNTQSCSNCGNGTIQAPEVCDGANLNGQTCATQGFAGGTLTCNAACSGFVTAACNDCGDGVLDAGEACDDGNAASNDGCSGTCQIEQPAGCTVTGFTLVQLGAAPVVLSGDNTNDLGGSVGIACAQGGGGDGNQVIFAVKPAATGFLTLSVPRATTTFDSVLAVRTTCGDAGPSSQACADSYELPNTALDGGEVISFRATANTVYYVVVAGYDAAESGTFQLVVDLSAGTCADPVPIPLHEGTPMALGGTTAGAGDDGTGSCNAVNPPDVVYAVTRDVAGNVAAGLTGAWDKALYTRTNCTMSNTQTACSDAGGMGAESLAAQAVDSVNPLFFWVDGHNNASHNGPYVLTLTP